jgi:transposase
MMEVLIGIDPHKATNAVAAIDEGGKLIELATFPTNRDGLRSLERWGKRFEKRRWAVEGAGGLGRPVAQHLVGAGERVVNVPPKLSARVRLLSAGNERKNDALDAVYTALAALRGERLAEVLEEDRASVLRMLSERREDLVRERTRTLNRLHQLLCDLLPGGATGRLSADRAARMLRRVRPPSAQGRTRRQLASELLRDVRSLDRRICKIDQRIRGTLKDSPTNRAEVFGVGPVLAAKIIGRVITVARFPSKAHFASYTGTAPVEVSSGGTLRHRLSRGGDRQLNHALHMVAICQITRQTEGRAYYLRKLAEGKSEREALRSLKRRISDAVFKKLGADLDGVVAAVA